MTTATVMVTLLVFTRFQLDALVIMDYQPTTLNCALPL